MNIQKQRGLDRASFRTSPVEDRVGQGRVSSSSIARATLFALLSVAGAVCCRGQSAGTSRERLALSVAGKCDSQSVYFAHRVTPYIDLDQDGVVDLAVSAACSEVAAREGDAERDGSVVFLSSKLGTVIKTATNHSPGTRYGSDVAVVDTDFDGDGARELLVGAPGSPESRGTGRVMLIGSRESRVLREYAALPEEFSFGSDIAVLSHAAAHGAIAVRAVAVVDERRVELCAVIDLDSGLRQFCVRGGEAARSKRPGRSVIQIGDVSSDGTDDFVFADDEGLVAYSGRDGMVLYHAAQRFGSDVSNQYGRTLCVTADINGDGVNDLAIGDPSDRPFRGGAVLLVSGQDGTTIRKVSGPPRSSGFGFEVMLGWDADGDGTRDLIVARHSAFHGGVSIVSPRDGHLIHDIDGALPEGPLMGWSVAALPDLDGDGWPDIATARFSNRSVGAVGQGVLVVSTRSGRVLAACCK